MPRQDTVDFLTAFAVGTVLGIGATLLLQPEKATKQRVVAQIKPYRKEMKRSYRQVKEGVRTGQAATGELTSEAITAGRELLGEFRGEVREILKEARTELRGIVQEELREARGARRTRRKQGA